MLFAVLAQELIFVAIAAYCWRRQRVSPEQVGAILPTKRQVLLGLVLGMVLWSTAYSVGGLLQVALKTVLPTASYKWMIGFHRDHTAIHGFMQLGRSRSARLAYVLLGSIAVPIGEEALFRGVIYRALRSWWGIKAAIVTSAVIFAIVHVSPLAIGVVFIVGVLLAWAYEETGSLSVPILMHCVNNALMFALMWRRLT